MIDNFSERFPGIQQICREAGFDPTAGPVPVVPAAHYSMGGIPARPDGSSMVQGLYAAGEAACTQVHGANRLAGNSLLECIAFSLLTAGAAAEYCRTTPNQEQQPQPVDTTTGINMLTDFYPDTAAEARLLLDEIWRLTETYLGIIRTRQGLFYALEKLKQLSARVKKSSQPTINENWDTLRFRREVRSILFAALACAEDAAARPFSMGVHYINDDSHDNDII